jgi:hypothetical protein
VEHLAQLVLVATVNHVANRLASLHALLLVLLALHVHLDALLVLLALLVVLVMPLDVLLVNAELVKITARISVNHQATILI